MDSLIVGGFVSTPIKLAALIDNKTSERKGNSSRKTSSSSKQMDQSIRLNLQRQINHRAPQTGQTLARPLLTWTSLILSTCLLGLSSASHQFQVASGNVNHALDGNLRHQAHYLNVIPSTNFNYNEGRQYSKLEEAELELRQQRAYLASSSNAANTNSISGRSMAANWPLDAPAISIGDQTDPMELKRAATQENQLNPHIYKRSSALISSPVAIHHRINQHNLNRNQLQANQNPALRRRMMSEINTSNSIIQSRWLASPSSQAASSSGKSAASLATSGTNQLDLVSEDSTDALEFANLAPRAQQVEVVSTQQPPIITTTSKFNEQQRDVLLRQKQHIQYHNEWSSTSSMGDTCHKRTLNFCASVLPFNTTTFPNIIGDTNRFDVKRSLPFFGFLAKSACNRRLDELLCLLLEPPCSPATGAAVPPCKKFCRLALEGCNEYIPATLALSSVFDCRQYPDSSDPNVCINLAQGSKCAIDEFKCPDKTCIPRSWLCDGVRDCVFAADEANCTAQTSNGQLELPSVCSTEEFKCDGKCVPKAWKCDGERDCLDGSDEEQCDLRPRCGPDRFKCADGNGCIPKRWVCDGKAECRDGSDELSCETRQCSESDFKCDNGICIPKIWRCDRQFDCKDGSDERACIYPTNSATLSPPQADVVVVVRNESYLNSSSSSSLKPEDLELAALRTLAPEAASQSAAAAAPLSTTIGESAAAARQQEISSDISRTIQRESLASSTVQEAPIISEQQVATTTTAPPVRNQQQQQQKVDMKKYDYDLIPTSGQQLAGGANQVAGAESSLQMAPQIMTQIDYVPQQTKTQRVPIYKSLFKTLKGAERVRGGAGSGQRNVVAVARRRRADRQQVAAMSRQTSNQQQLASPMRRIAMGVEQGNQAASYLQLLNGRYNIRHQQQD